MDDDGILALGEKDGEVLMLFCMSSFGKISGDSDDDPDCASPLYAGEGRMSGDVGDGGPGGGADGTAVSIALVFLSSFTHCSR